MLYFWGLQDNIMEDFADASGTEFDIPLDFDAQVSIQSC